MIKPEISLDNVIRILNDLVALDKPAVAALIANRVPCNQALADHPSVQVFTQNDGYHVGMLGVLNGLFGTDEQGRGPITVVFRDGHLEKFVRTGV